MLNFGLGCVRGFVQDWCWIDFAFSPTKWQESKKEVHFPKGFLYGNLLDSMFISQSAGLPDFSKTAPNHLDKTRSRGLNPGLGKH